MLIVLKAKSILSAFYSKEDAEFIDELWSILSTTDGARRNLCWIFRVMLLSTYSLSAADHMWLYQCVCFYCLTSKPGLLWWPGPEEPSLSSAATKGFLPSPEPLVDDETSAIDLYDPLSNTLSSLPFPSRYQLNPIETYPAVLHIRMPNFQLCHTFFPPVQQVILFLRLKLQHQTPLVTKATRLCGLHGAEFPMLSQVWSKSEDTVLSVCYLCVLIWMILFLQWPRVPSGTCRPLILISRRKLAPGL